MENEHLIYKKDQLSETYARFRAKFDAYNILLKQKYDPVSIFATSKIDPLPYQLEDFLDLLDSLNSKKGIQSLLSYETGLGKTIVSGLVIKELMLKDKRSRILVVAPPMSIYQWKAELETRFSTYATIYTNEEDLDKRLVIASMDTLKKRIDVLKKSGARWDLIVIDELHRATPGNQRYELIEWLRGKTEHFIALTATPHDGKTDHFIGRLQLINPAVDESNYKNFLETHNYRRLKKAVENLNGDPLFSKKVEVNTINIQPTDLEKEFYRKIENYVKYYYNLATKENNKGYGLVATIMGRMASSSISAGIRALKKRQATLLNKTLENLEKDMDEKQKYLEEKLEDYESGFFEEGEEFQNIADQVLELLGPERTDIEKELESIKDILELGKRAEEEKDSKIEDLKAIIQEHKSKGDKIVIFTSFVATAESIVKKLGEDGIYIVTGQIDNDIRQDNIKKFLENGYVLVGTEVIGESLNLQKANVVINYELPWSPIPYIQRVGRIYRYPQTKPIFIHNFSSELEIERRVLQVIYEKIDLLIKDFDEGSIEIIGNEISEKTIVETIQEGYLKGFENIEFNITKKVTDAYNNAEDLKKVLDISEAGKRHIDASHLLQNINNIITEDDLKIFLENASQCNIGSGDPYSIPPSYKLEDVLLKKLDINDECIQKCLKKAIELYTAPISLIWDKNKNAIVQEIKYLEDNGTIFFSELAIITDNAIYPYHFIRDKKVSDKPAISTTISETKKLELLKDNLKKQNEKYREQINREGDLISHKEIELKNSKENINYIEAKLDTYKSEREELSKKYKKGLKLQLGDVIGYISFYDLHNKESNEEEYNEQILKERSKVEQAAMNYVIEYEKKREYVPKDVHDENLGYDITSTKLGEVKYIEVKGISDINAKEAVITENEYRASNHFKDSYYLYVVINPIYNPILKIIKPPFKVIEKPIMQYIVPL